VSTDQLDAFVAEPGLYQAVLKLLDECGGIEGRSIIDLGAGTGAFARLLHQRGAEVQAADLQLFSSFRAAEVPFVPVDLDDREFASQLGGPFDYVVTIETIEHLENPVSFLRNIGRLLSPQGLAVVTTPNVVSLASRLEFLRTGNLRGFRPSDEPTHISPITDTLMRGRLAPAAGLTLLQTLTHPPDAMASGGSWRRRLLNGALRSFRASGPTVGEIVIWVLGRSDVDRLPVTAQPHST
jgi:SAM-dependent methyltransferase